MSSAVQPAVTTLARPSGEAIALCHRKPSDPRAPTVLFLPGYGSDMAGQKALAIDAWCHANELGCMRFDYRGTGLSPGRFADGTLDLWLDDSLAALDAVDPRGPIIVAGSSMGGWIGLHVALRRRARVAALLGIAAAPDFTDWGFTAAMRAELHRDGRLVRGDPADGNAAVDNAQVTHLNFWRSGEALRLLTAPIDLAIPVRLVHGTADEVVPPSVALSLLDRLGSADVQLRLVKGAGHRLNEAHEIAAILAELAALVALVDQERPSE